MFFLGLQWKHILYTGRVRIRRPKYCRWFCSSGVFWLPRGQFWCSQQFTQRSGACPPRYRNWCPTTTKQHRPNDLELICPFVRSCALFYSSSLIIQQSTYCKKKSMMIKIINFYIRNFELRNFYNSTFERLLRSPMKQLLMKKKKFSHFKETEWILQKRQFLLESLII